MMQAALTPSKSAAQLYPGRPVTSRDAAPARRCSGSRLRAYNAAMSLIELPHTRGCVACGHDNPHGLGLALHVETEDGTVTVQFVPRAQDIGFEGIIHGGVLAMVVDEAMVWAA